MADAAEGEALKCIRCGQPHALPECPYVKSVRWRRDGTIRSVVFLTPADYGPPQKPEPAGDETSDYPKLGQPQPPRG